MKNKKFTKWLLRLPVLLVALIMLISPLSMAVPASANVLTGDVSYVFYSNGLSLTVPQLFDYSVVVIQPGPIGGLGVFLITSHDVLSVDGTYPSVTVSGSDCLIYYEFIPQLSDVVFSDPPGFSENYSRLFENISGFVVTPDVSVSVPNLLEIAVVSPVLSYDSVGILSVFSGVGSWLSGALQNISTMFWTAESGITVLGYLAVAPLTVAVTLLIFYLIAGWLKFH